MKKRNLDGTISNAIGFVEKENNFLTIGIEATYPATRFGYIKYSKYNNHSSYYNVIEFKEKPILEKAEKFIETKDYVWNSGIFFGKISTILDHFQKYLPSIHRYMKDLENSIGASNEREKIEKIYNEVEAISIDKGILEKANSLKMMKADFIWKDIGDLKELFNLKESDSNHNISWGNCITYETEKTNIYNGEDGILITLGVSNLSIIKNNDICLVCNNEQINKIPEIYKKIKDK